MSRRIGLVFGSLLLIGTSTVRAADDSSRPAPNSDKEPMAERFSIERGAKFLDSVSVDWTRQRKCGTCHTNYAHMMAGPTVEKIASTELAEVRAFFEGRATGWDRPEKAAKPIAQGEIVATAAALALYDAASTGKLHPISRSAHDRIWTIQRPDGGWNWFDCDLPPSEDDDYYGTTLAAIAVGHAPDDYKSTEAARRGLVKLRKYLHDTPAPNLHHRALLLWASTGVDGLMDGPERERTVADLIAKQRPDGGWSLTSLGRWTRRDGTPNSEDAPSDGYGTGYVVYVLRQSGMPADAPAIRRGIDWIKTHQRASGRWFTRSPSLDHAHYLTHAGTGFVLMALAACGEK
jgi:squalene-hopene/tetraprenyl-beta-curcumene cyclase